MWFTCSVLVNRTKLPLHKLVVPDLFYKININTVVHVLKIPFFLIADLFNIQKMTNKKYFFKTPHIIIFFTWKKTFCQLLKKSIQLSPSPPLPLEDIFKGFHTFHTFYNVKYLCSEYFLYYWLYFSNNLKQRALYSHCTGCTILQGTRHHIEFLKGFP